MHFACSVAGNEPRQADKLQDSTDPRVLWRQVLAACKHTFGDRLEAKVEFLTEHPDSEFLTGAKFYFLNERGQRWYSIEVELVVSMEGQAQPAAHWVRNILQLNLFF